MHLRAVAGILPVLSTLSGVAWAGPPVVTEADLLAQLDGDLPAVVASSSPLPSARAELIDARLLENPVLELGHEDPSGAVAQTEWLLSWQLPGSTRRLEIDAAEKSLDAATARVEHRLRELRAALRADYARWAVAATRRQLLEDEVSRLEALASREDARARTGESSGLDSRRLDLAAAALRVRLSLAAADERRARAEVVRWWPELPADARPELPPLPDPSGGDSADGALLEDEHPRITAARAEADAADLAQRASERYWASPELTLGWQRQEAFEATESGAVIGLAWTVPIFDRRQAERDAARVRLEVARAEVEIAARETEARRSTAVSRYAELVRGTADAEAAIEPSHGMGVAAETAFRYGELPLTDLLEIQRSLSDARLAWLELHAAALAAHRELEALAGPATPTTFHTQTLSQPEESQP